MSKHSQNHWELSTGNLTILMATFSERLKMLRERAKLTQQQIAEKLGFSTGAVGNWESGLNMPSRKAMRQLSGILGTTELFLSGESDIDSFSYMEQAPDYSGALPFARMTADELQFIFDSRHKELLDSKTSPERRGELLGIISEVAGEMKKRIPEVSSKEIAAAGALKIFEAAKQAVSSEPSLPAPKNRPSDGGHQGSKSPTPGEQSSKKQS